MSLLIPFSSATLRKRYYEVFLIIHILSAIVIVCALFMCVYSFLQPLPPPLRTPTNNI